MKKNKIIVRVAGIISMCIISVFYHAGAHAQDVFNDPLSFYGGADLITLNNDTVMVENILLDDASGITPERNISLNVAYLYSRYCMLGFIGVSYSPLSFLEINATIPYIYRTVAADSHDEYSKRGYGDTKLAANFFVGGLTEGLDSTTSINVTIPTGDLAASDTMENVPLGYGNFTTGLMESLSYRLPASVTKLPFRFFINIGSQFFSSVTLEKNATVRESYSWYFVGYGLLGVEYSFFPFLRSRVKYNLMYHPERTYESESLLTPGSPAEVSREDRLIASDVIFDLAFDVKEYVSGSLSFVLPVMDLRDNSKPAGADRRWKIMLSLSRNFSTGPEKKTEKKENKPVKRNRRKVR